MTYKKKTENLASFFQISNISDIHYYKLVPINMQEVEDLVAKKAEICFRADSYSELNMMQILAFVEENFQMKIQIDRLKESG